MGNDQNNEKIQNRQKIGVEQIILPIGVLFFVIFLFLTLCLHINDKNGLESVSVAAEPKWSIDSAMDGTYQRAWGSWLNDNFLGHTFAVKCHNQLQYSLFRDGNAQWGIGKDFMLFEGSAQNGYGSVYYHVTEANREGFLEELDAYAQTVAQFQEKLAAIGKDFVYLISPMKHEVYTDMLPWNERILAERYSWAFGYLRRSLAQAFDKYGVHYYDMTDDMIAIRETASYEVYPKTGYHWTTTAIANEANTLFENIKDMTPHIDYPQIEVVGVKNQLYPTDRDILLHENVFFGVESDDYQMPIIQILKRSESPVFYFGTSMGIEMFDALEENGYGAFDNYIYQHYFTWLFLHCADEGIQTRQTFVETDPPAALKIMEHIQSSDLIIMEQYAGHMSYTHPKFLSYVLPNLDYLYYNLGDNAVTYTEDMAGIKLEGFYNLEPKGRWTTRECSVTVLGDAMKDASSNIDLRLFMSSYYTDQNVEISVNGSQLVVLPVTPEAGEYTITIPAEIICSGENTIEFFLLEPLHSPKEAAGTDDVRFLGLAIESMVLEASK